MGTGINSRVQWATRIHETPDPDLTGHRGDKNTQTDGRVHRHGKGEAANTTKDFREEQNCNYSVGQRRPSMWLSAKPEVDARSEVMTSLTNAPNGNIGRGRCGGERV